MIKDLIGVIAMVIAAIVFPFSFLFG